MRFDFEVGPPDAGRRLDRFVQGVLGRVPPSLVRRLLRRKKIRVNGERGRAEQRLVVGDHVAVHHVPRAGDRVGQEPPRPRATAYAGPRIEVLLRRDDLLFVAKPAGVACSDDGADPRSIAAWLEEYLREEIANGRARPEPCHRLDRGTTGVVAIALTAAAFERFRRGLAVGEIRKEYEVAVWGAPDWERHRCDLPLRRRVGSRADEPKMEIAEKTAEEDARPASTVFEVLARGPDATRLRARPITGRTHQIRAHCRALELPVIGDVRYGRKDRSGPDEEPSHQLLHATCLVLEDEEPHIEVRATWPPEDQAVLRALGIEFGSVG